MPIVHSVSDYFDVSIHLPAFSPDELSWHDPHLGEMMAKISGPKLSIKSWIMMLRTNTIHQISPLHLVLGSLRRSFLTNELSDLVSAQQTAKQAGNIDLLGFSSDLRSPGPPQKTGPLPPTRVLHEMSMYTGMMAQLPGSPIMKS